MTKRKYYVVWEGLSRGIYDNWAECEQQIKEYPNAKYKSFETQPEAINAFRIGYSEFYKTQKVKSQQFTPTNGPVYPSLAVDAACSGVPGPMEYQGVDAKTKRQLFHIGPIPDGTNNVGEFLAIVHGLALLKNNSCNYPIYSDSITAISWVRKKKANTKMLPTQGNTILFEYIQRAEKWLNENSFTNPIIKWDTSAWGEIPADFGRK